VDKSYKRAENIDEKIKQAKLTYNGWRTLFLLDENTSTTRISEILEEKFEAIEAEVQRLLDEELVLLVPGTEDVVPEDSREQEVAVDEEPEQVQEETAEQETVIEDEAEQPEEEVEIVEEALEAELEEETLVEEEVVEPEPEPEPEAEPEPEPEAVLDIEDEIEIKIHDEEESGADLLDVDFADQEAEPEPEPTPEPEVAPEPEPEPEKPEPEPPLDVELPPAPAPTGKKTILVVDDSIVIRKMVEIALENEDLLVQTAVSGKDGLDKIDQLNPSLIILDLMLPDINGIDILKTVKASRQIPVIMLSGKDSPQMVEKAKEAGADAFLPKPFKDSELKEQIKSLLEG